MKKRTKLLVAGILIIIGGTFMRFAWIIFTQLLSTFLMLLGAFLFLAGIIFFANTFFDRKGKF